MISQTQIYTLLIRMWYNSLNSYLKLKEQMKIEAYTTFHCRIKPLNLSDFVMNLIEDLNMLQFCWSLNLLLITTISRQLHYFIIRFIQSIFINRLKFMKYGFSNINKIMKVQKKQGTDSTSKLQEHKGFTHTLKS